MTAIAMTASAGRLNPFPEASVVRPQLDGEAVLPPRVKQWRVRTLARDSASTRRSPALDGGGAIDLSDYVVLPVRFPVDQKPSASIDVLQKWEGRVLENGKDFFRAVVFDLVDMTTEEEVEFDLAEVTDDDLALVRPGAVFYWSVGYRVEVSRTKSRTSLIRFRRLPVWSRDDLRRRERRVSEYREALGP